MEKEKSDGASPRGVLEACINCSGSDPPSPQKIHEESERASCTGSKKLSQWGKFFKLWKKRSIRRLASFPPLTISKMSKRKSGGETEGITPVFSEIYNFKSTLKHFSLSDLAAATNNFSPGTYFRHSQGIKLSLIFCLLFTEITSLLLEQIRHDF